MKIAPTRANFLSLKAQLKMAKEGHSLLSEKRQVLLMELVTRVSDLKKIKKAVEEKFSAAFKVLRQAILTLGDDKIDYLARIYGDSLNFELLERSAMGVLTVEIIPSKLDLKISSSLWDTNPYYDELQQELTKLYPLVFKWLSLRITIIRLGEELLKTQKRVNALENIFIPEYEQAIEWISNVLEETAREEFFRVKKQKKKAKEKQGT
jgi:V/A-type H+/Na+-transporting ATPase subunit D